jgi:hypothetical protein
LPHLLERAAEAQRLVVSGNHDAQEGFGHGAKLYGVRKR